MKNTHRRKLNIHRLEMSKMQNRKFGGKKWRNRKKIKWLYNPKEATAEWY